MYGGVLTSSEGNVSWIVCWLWSVTVRYMIYVCLGYMFAWLVCLSMHVSMVGGEGDVNSIPIIDFHILWEYVPVS